MVVRPLPGRPEEEMGQWLPSWGKLRVISQLYLRLSLSLKMLELCSWLFKFCFCRVFSP